MAEQYVSSDDYLYNLQESVDGEQSSTIGDNIIHIDPRPIIDWDEKMRRIGAEIIAFQKLDNGLTEFSHNPISCSNEQTGSVSVYFEKFQAGHTGNEIGVRFQGERNGIETRSVIVARFNESTHTVETYDVHQRNYRYIFPGLESRRRDGKAESESERIRHFLWHNPSNNDTRD
jgi:hypothetical protein